VPAPPHNGASFITGTRNLSTEGRFAHRGTHRARSHKAAHATEDSAGDDVVEMDLVHRGEPDLVETDAQLALLIERLRADGSFAYDSEFIGEASYHPRLCLVQVASKSCLALIDPLAAVDLTPYWELLADAAVTKIVHAGDSDLEPVARHLGRPAANVLDTQIAAGFIGLTYPISLKKFLVELTGVSLGRDLGFSDWAQRPLSPVQLRYAADDVRYLPAACRELMRRVDALGRRRWVEEECAAACAMSRFTFDPETQFLRVRGAGALAPRNQAVLRELTVWRDAQARRNDRPPRAFMKDEVLIDLARAAVRSAAELGRVRALPRSVAEAHAAEIIQATSRAMSMPAPDLPGPSDTELSAAEKFRSDALFAAMQSLCAGSSLDPALVASRKELDRFYQHIEGGMASATPALLCGWRKEALGGWLAAFLHGEAGAELRWEDGTLQAARTRA
jgi:ribonuclease D